MLANTKTGQRIALRQKVGEAFFSKKKRTGIYYRAVTDIWVLITCKKYAKLFLGLQVHHRWSQGGPPYSSSRSGKTTAHIIKTKQLSCGLSNSHFQTKLVPNDFAYNLSRVP